ncbi:hypothetical protein [Pseudomonas synxantha]|uniref:hypothetical protein n=1 Tax=Pseudomonas synxantha TaxID=47883 RepID=UPI001652D8EE|nr:hypothetical protein [Pseudomonas synxantha]
MVARLGPQPKDPKSAACIFITIGIKETVSFTKINERCHPNNNPGQSPTAKIEVTTMPQTPDEPLSGQSHSEIVDSFWTLASQMSREKPTNGTPQENQQE